MFSGCLAARSKLRSAEGRTRSLPSDVPSAVTAYATRASRRALCLLLLALALAGTGTAAAHAAAGGHAAGCPASSRFPVGDPRRVYAVPGGCVWILRPGSTRAGMGPIVEVRAGGTTRRVGLSNQPFGDAYGFCGVSFFFVSGPYITITATRAWLGQSAGCVAIRGSAMIWVEQVRPDGYLHEIAESPAWHNA